jgi:thiamine pyrophosphate-dependent acetolactate synthase large subunit-like protein
VAADRNRWFGRRITKTVMSSEPMSSAPLPVQLLEPDEPFAADFILAGHGVIDAGAVGALNAFAERTGLGVLNTFTSKGMFRWDSPYHLGTGCLQERDLQLAGARADSPILVVGVDTDECRPALLRATGIDPDRLGESAWRAIAIADLEPAAQNIRPTWGAPPTPPPQPDMFTVMWNLAQPLYKLEDAPLNPARAASDIVAALGPEGVICAEAGRAGWWVARTVPTVRLGSVQIPASAGPKSVGAAYRNATAGIPAVAVIDAPLDPVSEEFIDAARETGLTMIVEIWGDDSGELLDAADHQARVREALGAGGVTVLRPAIDFSPTADLVAACGPLIAWT